MRLRCTPLAPILAWALMLPGFATAEDWACSAWEGVTPSPGPLHLSSVTYGRGRFWAPGAGGIIFTSPDGVDWKPFYGGRAPTSLQWTGTELLGPSGGSVLASRDGYTWVTRLEMPGPASHALLSLATRDGTTVAVGYWMLQPCMHCDPLHGPVVQTSLDGIEWTSPQLPAVGSYLWNVTWAHGAFIAVGTGLATSPDGLTWTGHPGVSGTTVAGNQNAVVVAGDDGIFVSHDLLSWQHLPGPVTEGAVSAVGDRLFLAGRCLACPDREPSLWSSLDGEGWQRLGLDAPTRLSSFASHGTRLVAVGEGAAVSDDGSTWRTARPQLAKQLNDVAFLGSTAVAVGEQGEVLIGNVGSAWRRVLWGGAVPLREVAAGVAGFVAVGEGVVLASPDGSVWSRHETGGSGSPTSVASTGPVYVVGTATDAILRSTNGTDWTPADLSTLGWQVTGIHRIVASSSTFVAAVAKGSDGTALIASQDGLSWHMVVEPVRQALAIVQGGERFVAAHYGTVLTSADGMTWSHAAQSLTLSRLGWAAGRFLARAEEPNRLVSSVDGTTWIADTWVPQPSMTTTDDSLWQSSESAGLRRSRCGPRVTIADLPSLAHSDGAQGTRWRSELVVHNPGTETVTVSLGKLSTAFSIRPGEIHRFDDVLANGRPDLPEWSTSYALRLESWGGPVLAAARTYNDTPVGTYGQLIPAFSEAGAAPTGQELRLIQLGHADDRARGFRTNLGFGNIGSPSYVDIELWSSTGTLLQRQSILPGDWMQLNDVLRLPGTGDVPDAFAMLRTTSPGGRLHAYASVVDNRTGDPMLITPTAGIEVGQVAWIPGAGHVVGLNGSVWRTDLELHNPGARNVECRAELFPWGEEVRAPAAVTISVPAGRSVRLPDVVGESFAHQGGASLRLLPTGGAVMASARIFSTGTAGSVGQLLPALSPDQAVTPGSPRRIIMLRQSAIRTVGFRSNLGLMSTTAVPTTVKIDLRDGSGRRLGTLTQLLEAFESVQLSEVLRRVTGNEVSDATAEIRTTTAGAAVLAYGCLIDNRTNDPLLIPAQ